MKLRWHLSAIIGAVLAGVFFSTLKVKPPEIPADALHRPLLERIAGGAAEAIGECLSCHNPEKNPLPKEHPANEKCLACHPAKAGQ